MATPSLTVTVSPPDLSALSGKIKLVLSSFPQWDLQTSEVKEERSLSDFEPPEATFVLGKEEKCQPALVISHQEVAENESDDSSSSSSSSDDETKPKVVTIPVPKSPNLEHAKIPDPPPSFPVDPKRSTNPPNPSEAVTSDPLPASKPPTNIEPETNPKPTLPTDLNTAEGGTKPSAEIALSNKTGSGNIGSPGKPKPPVPTLQPAASEQPLGRMMVITSRPLMREANSKVPIMVTKSEDVSPIRPRETQESPHSHAPDMHGRSVCSGCYLW